MVEVWVDWVLLRIGIGCLPSSRLCCLLRGVLSMSESLYAGTLPVRTSDLFGVPCLAYLEVHHASNDNQLDGLTPKKAKILASSRPRYKATTAAKRNIALMIFGRAYGHLRIHQTPSLPPRKLPGPKTCGY